MAAGVSASASSSSVLGKAPDTVYIAVPLKLPVEREVFQRLAEHERFLRGAKGKLAEKDVQRIEKDLVDLQGKSKVLVGKVANDAARRIEAIAAALNPKPIRKSTSLPSLKKGAATPVAEGQAASRALLATNACRARAAYNAAVTRARDIRKAGTGPSQYRSLSLAEGIRKGAPLKCSRFDLSHLQPVSANDDLYSLYSSIAKSPIASKLLNDAKRETAAHGNALLLRSVPKDQVRFGGWFRFAEGQIIVDQQETGVRKLRSLLFELANATHTKKFLDVQKKLKAGGFATAEDFALAMETIEFESARLYAKVVGECIEKEKWDKRLDVHNWKDFETYLAAQKASGHFQYYVDQFKK